MLSDHLHNITANLPHTWADLRDVPPKVSLAIVAQVLLIALLIDYGRMLWLRFKMVRLPCFFPALGYVAG